MRIISRKTLINYWGKYPETEHSLKSWYDEALNATWASPNELKKNYSNASKLTNKRVVFNIKGNKHRLVTDIEYRIGIVFIVWLGTHNEYDKMDIKEIKYVKTN